MPSLSWPAVTREDAIEALMRTGKNREQAEAFLTLLGSGFARRGWIDGPVLSDVEIRTEFEKFIGPCCDLHGRNCEPPSELCCRHCTETAHPDHADESTCSNPDLSASH
jgi:hypothetical protein